MASTKVEMIKRISSEIDALLERLSEEANSNRSDMERFEELWTRICSMDDLRRTMIRNASRDQGIAPRILGGLARLQVSSIKRILESTVE